MTAIVVAAPFVNVAISSAQTSAYSITELDRPLQLTKGTHADVRDALDSVAAIRDALKAAQKEYDAAEAVIGPAMAEQQKALQAATSVLIAMSNDVDGAGGMFAKSWADYEHRRLAFDNALLRWSHQYSRLYRLRMRRLLMLAEIYQNPPVYLQSAGVASADGVYGYYEVDELPEIVEWYEKLSVIGKSLAAVQANVRMLTDNHQRLQEEYAELGARVDELTDDYQRRLLIDKWVKIIVDTEVSLSNLFTGGPYALVFEAGYQGGSAIWYGFGGRPDFVADGYNVLTDYSWDAPPVPDDLRNAVKIAAGGLAAAERQEALHRLRSDTVIDWMSGADEGPATSFGDGPGALDNAVTFAGNVLWGSLPSAANSLGGSPVLKYIDRWVAHSRAPAVVLEDRIRAMVSGGVSLNLATQLTMQAPPSEALLLDVVSKNTKFLLGDEFWITGTWKGLGASVGALALGEAVKSVADEIGTSRAKIVVEQAQIEIEWHLKRRQMTAHRLLTERYIANMVMVHESAFDAIKELSLELKSLRRKKRPEETPLITIAADKPLHIVTEMSAPARPYTLVVHGAQVRLPGTGAGQADKLMKMIVDPDVAVVEDPRGPALSAPSADHDEYDIDDRLIKESRGFGLFYYPTHHDPSDPRTAYEIVRSEYFLDLDPITPALYFDEGALKWVGQERDVRDRLTFLFDLQRPVSLKLRNRSETIYVPPK